KISRDFFVFAARHIDGKRSARGGKGFPCRIGTAAVGGKENEFRGDAAPGKRDLRGGSGSRGCGDAGNDFEFDAGFGECGDLLAGPTEDEGIASLEPNNRAAGASMLDEKSVNLVLGNGGCTAALAYGAE